MKKYRASNAQLPQKKKGNTAVVVANSIDSFGTLLKKLREDAGLSLDMLAERTKINKQYLEYMEAEEFSKLPPAVYVRGFILRCGKFLGEENTLSLLRLYAAKTNQNLESQSAIKKKMAAKTNFLLGPQHIAFIFGAIFLFAVASFLMARFTPFLLEPDVKISNPAAENTVANFSVLNVEGRARFSSSLTLNGDMLYIGEKGLFSKEIELKEGVNRINLEAKNVFGRKAEVVRRVVYIKN